MRNVDQRLQRVQEQQTARQEDLQKGRVRVESPERETSSQSDNKDRREER